MYFAATIVATLCVACLWPMSVAAQPVESQPQNASASSTDTQPTGDAGEPLHTHERATDVAPTGVSHAASARQEVSPPSPIVNPSSAPGHDLQPDGQPQRNREPSELPAYLLGKPRMRQDDIDEKTVGTYVTGVPIFMYDTNKGFGLGGRVALIDNGKRESPFFEYTPYRHQLYAQLIATTGGWQFHKLDYDGIFVKDSPFRVRATLFYEKNTEATFFGVGSASMNDLYWSGSNRSYSTYSSLEHDLRQVRPDGTVGTAYNLYRLERPGASVSLEREFFGGRLRVRVGAMVRHARITPYDARVVHGDDPTTGRTDISATQGPTLLTEQCAAGRAVGCDGGWDNVARLALTFDTRDFEPDPNTGFFAGVSSQLAPQAFGNGNAYGRVSFQVRTFVSPIPQTTDLVIALRATYQMQSQKTPIHSMPTMTFTDTDEEGLGGLRTLRGYQQNRFVGPSASFVNAELRWMPVKFRAVGQLFGLGLVPFLDAGRVYDRVDLSFRKWRLGSGAGLRIAWNQATIVVADYGVSTEDRSFGLTFGHHF